MLSCVLLCCHEITQTPQEALAHMQIFKCFKTFRQECRGLEHDPRSGLPPTVWNLQTVTKIFELVAGVRRITLKMMENQLHINQKMTVRFFINLVKRKICMKLVPQSCVRAHSPMTVKCLLMNCTIEEINHIIYVTSHQSFLSLMCELLPKEENFRILSTSRGTQLLN